MPGKYINPCTDFGFKRIFGQEANKDILVAFLNSILPEKHQIAELRFLNTEFTPSRAELYAPLLDLYCVSPSGEQFIVEMQQKHQLLFIDRSVYYTACAIREQYERGRRDLGLAAVYFVGIMNFIHRIENHPPRLVHELSLKDQDGVEMYDKLRMYFIQMPLFTKTESALETPMDKWLFFLRNLPGLDHIPAVFGEPVFEKAFHVAATANMTREEEWAYRFSLGSQLSNQDILDTAKADARAEGMEKGKAEGMKKGKAEGMKKGKAEGMKKGKAEGMKKGKAEGKAEARAGFVRQMKSFGLSEADIAAILNQRPV